MGTKGRWTPPTGGRERDPPRTLAEWRWHCCLPPYRKRTRLRRLADLLGETRDGRSVPPGLILVGSPASLRPDRALRELDWLVTHLPWASLALEMPVLSGHLLTSLIVRTARRGIVPLLDADLDPGAIARRVVSTSVPELDLAPWLQHAASALSARDRSTVVEQFRYGYAFDPEETRRGRPGGALPRNQPTWVRAGRGIRGCLELQARSYESLERVALSAGYSDHRAMERSVLRLFGVRLREARRGVGWRWLLWRLVLAQGLESPVGINRPAGQGL